MRCGTEYRGVLGSNKLDAHRVGKQYSISAEALVLYLKSKGREIGLGWNTATLPYVALLSNIDRKGVWHFDNSLYSIKDNISFQSLSVDYGHSDHRLRCN